MEEQIIILKWAAVCGTKQNIGHILDFQHFLIWTFGNIERVCENCLVLMGVLYLE